MKRWMSEGTLCALVLLGSLSMVNATEQEAIKVHEWGTFTSLQNEQGEAIGGINTDDEPVPDFVHDIAKRLLIPATEVPPTFFQGAPACHPDVTLRLETPVLYVYAPKSFRGKIDVEVEFRGGWLTQFYPNAEVVAPGVAIGSAQAVPFGHLKPTTTGKLSWREISVNPENSSVQGPLTEDPVWLAPRKVAARMLSSAKGENERFLFYRGVGNLESPIRVVRDPSGKELKIGWNAKSEPAGEVKKLWLADIRPYGSGAFRVLETHSGSKVGDAILATTSANFDEGDYSTAAIPRLRGEMKKALVEDGLFEDEAEALLNTWELSYFKSAGLRLFFLVPQSWTDHVLPLAITVPKGSPKANVTRVMVGRIEIVSPRQRELLATIAKGPVPDPWKDIREKVQALTLGAGKTEQWNDVVSGKCSLKEIGLDVPPVYQAYLDLGRFRSALVLDEARRNPALADFVDKLQIEAYKLD